MTGTVLVTGGFGLVGSATVRRLVELGDRDQADVLRVERTHVGETGREVDFVGLVADLDRVPQDVGRAVDYGHLVGARVDDDSVAPVVAEAQGAVSDLTGQLISTSEARESASVKAMLTQFDDEGGEINV